MDAKLDPELDPKFFPHLDPKLDLELNPKMDPKYDPDVCSYLGAGARTPEMQAFLPATTIYAMRMTSELQKRKT